MNEMEKLDDLVLKEIGDSRYGPYFTFWSRRDVCLDGDFTKRELEIIAKHMEYEAETNG